MITAQCCVRTVPDRRDGSPHLVETTAQHREVWVYTNAGWMTQRVQELATGPVLIDGKPLPE